MSARTFFRTLHLETEEPEKEEESIDDYMNRLMQRVQSSGAPESVNYTPSSPTPRHAAPTALTAPPTAATVEPPKQQADEMQPPGTIAPRTVAPETHTDLSAFRELANLSAHTAIGRHSRQMLVRTMYSKLAVVIVALTTAGALFWMWRSLNTTQMTLYSALLALLITIYWSVQYALLTGRLIIGKSGHIDVDWKAIPFIKKTASSDEDNTVAKDADGNVPAEDDDGLDLSS